MNVLDRHCPSCGRSQSILDDEVARDFGDELLEKASQAIESELETACNDIPNNRSAGGPGLSRRKGGGSCWKLGQLAPQAEADLFDFAGRHALDTPVAEIQQMAQFVFYSSHVQSNLLYRERAGRTTLHYLPEADTVNAFATDARIPEFDAEPPLIGILGGMTRVSRLMAFALAEEVESDKANARQRLKRIIRQVGQKVVEGEGSLALADAEEIFEGLAPSVSPGKARSYNAALNMTVIAHELGHIALGHTLGSGPACLEISRNQEREADSFAASVAGSSPFGDYIVAGGVFFWVIMAWIDAAAGDAAQTTHPHARERLLDYIRANQEQAAAIGFDAENVGAFLPF